MPSSPSLGSIVPSRVQDAFAGVYPSKARPALPREASRAGADYGRSAAPDWREIDWSRYRRRVQVAGREVNYVDIGEGDRPPVVFVHGLGGNWQDWLENLPRVARERRAIALDLPGFGASEMPAEHISISAYGRWVEELCRRVGIDAAVVVGNSMGGFIAAEIAIAYPQLVERLVLAAAAGISVTSASRRPTLKIARFSTALTSITSSNRRQVVARPRLRHLLLASIVRHPSLIAPDLLMEVLKGSHAPGHMPATKALLDYDFTDRLADIGCPTLVVWGAEDILVPVGDADEFERLIPDSRKVVFDETGHAPMLERPIEFNECLVEFLGERGEAGGGARSADGSAPPFGATP